MLKYVFMGSPELARVILEEVSSKYGSPSHVVTQPPRPQGRGKKTQPTAVGAYCEKMGWPLIATDNVNLPEHIATLKASKPDLILVAAFGQLLRQSVLELPSLYCLNVHASLLPAYRGAAPIQMAIWNGDRTTGVTIQKMVKKLDAGDILLQKETPIGPNDTSADLLDRLAVLGGQALVEALHVIEKGNASFSPQQESLATKAPKISKQQGHIQWTQSASQIDCQVRALIPWPIAETRLGGQRLKIHRVEKTDGTAPGEPGEIVTDSKTFLKVACGNGTSLNLTEVQPENKKKLTIAEYLAAFRGNFPFNKMDKHD